MKASNQELIVIFKESGFIVDTNQTSAKEFFFDSTLYQQFTLKPDNTLLRLGFLEKKPEMSASMRFLHNIASTFIRELARDPDIEFTRTASGLSEDVTSELLYFVPYALGAEYITTGWLQEVWDRLARTFEEEALQYEGSIEQFLLEFNAGLHIVGRVFFHLVENKENETYPFAFLATYSTAGSNGKKASHLPLKNALLEYKGKKDILALLSAVSKAADKSNFISEMVESGELFSPLKFTNQEAYVFLKEIPLYEECGILCRIPDWWKKKTSSIRMSVSVGEKAPSKVGTDALLEFEPELYLGELKLTKEELEQLLAEADGLTMIKGKWVEVDHGKLEAILAAYENARSMSAEGELTLAEAMRAQLTLQKELNLSNSDVPLEVTQGTWLRGVKDRLLHPGELKKLELGEGFQAVLRAYQQTGLDWLHYMKNLGFGALLADDMGLGKTLQVLALLEWTRTTKEEKALLIVPASLIGNWQKEIEKCAPHLPYKVLHGSAKESFYIDEQEDVRLYITTYGMAVRLEELRNHNWDMLVLDEAQAIKNPGTKQTKAVKQIPSRFRIAMTGTPVENRMTDLWSIFDFINVGMLGTLKEFTEFTKKEEDYQKLRSVVSPFILRRLKTDKSIISDLPDKVEMNAYTSLTKKQLVLYKSLVQELEQSLRDAEGIQRKGLVLASIMKFKQICNHPAQYLGQKEYEAALSGKFEKLQEICEVIYEKRERVLVFTQFKEMTEPIADFLAAVFQRKGLVLHGGTQVKKRGELVERFCSQEYIPFMVLSLKAGGVGLNLTAANHVIHFDRWWNPAIENQATDRAFRIGQQKNVIVHKFITSGTIEEKIDAMIAEKQKMANDIIASTGENWITELSNDELISMCRLS